MSVCLLIIFRLFVYCSTPWFKITLQHFLWKLSGVVNEREPFTNFITWLPVILRVFIVVNLRCNLRFRSIYSTAFIFGKVMHTSSDDVIIMPSCYIAVRHNCGGSSLRNFSDTSPTIQRTNKQSDDFFMSNFDFRSINNIQVYVRDVHQIEPYLLQYWTR